MLIENQNFESSIIKTLNMNYVEGTNRYKFNKIVFNIIWLTELKSFLKSLQISKWHENQFVDLKEEQQKLM